VEYEFLISHVLIVLCGCVLGTQVEVQSQPQIGGCHNPQCDKAGGNVPYSNIDICHVCACSQGLEIFDVSIYIVDVVKFAV